MMRAVPGVAAASAIYSHCAPSTPPAHASRRTALNRARQLHQSAQVPAHSDLHARILPLQRVVRRPARPAARIAAGRARAAAAAAARGRGAARVCGRVGPRAGRAGAVPRLRRDLHARRVAQEQLRLLPVRMAGVRLAPAAGRLPREARRPRPARARARRRAGQRAERGSGDKRGRICLPAAPRPGEVPCPSCGWRSQRRTRQRILHRTVHRVRKVRRQQPLRDSAYMQR